MKEFPQRFVYKNISIFPTLLYDRNISYLRRDIYEHMLKSDKEDSFNLQQFDNERIGDMEITNQMANTIIDELINRGWECALAYGSTCLYIFPPGDKPITCGEEIS